MSHTIRTMTEEDLTLPVDSVGIRTRFRVTHRKVCFYIDVRAFLQMTKVIIRVPIKGKDVMPGSLGLRTSCQSDASVPQRNFRVGGRTAIGIRGRRRKICRGNRVTVTRRARMKWVFSGGGGGIRGVFFFGFFLTPNPPVLTKAARKD